jgi:hypothetical protein
LQWLGSIYWAGASNDWQ